MSLGRRYDISRYNSILLREDTPGRYRKLSDDEIALEWERSRLQQANGNKSPNANDAKTPKITPAKNPGIKSSQSLNVGKREDKTAGKRHKSKSLSGKEEKLLKEHPVRKEGGEEAEEGSFTREDPRNPEPLDVDFTLTSRGAHSYDDNDKETPVFPVTVSDTTQVKPKKEKKTKKDRKKTKSKRNTCEIHKKKPGKDSVFKKYFDNKKPDSMSHPKHCRSCTCEKGGIEKKGNTTDTSSLSSRDDSSSEHSIKHSDNISTSSSSHNNHSTDASSSTPRDPGTKPKVRPEKPQRSPRIGHSSSMDNSPKDTIVREEQAPLSQHLELPGLNESMGGDSEGYLSEGRSGGLVSLFTDDPVLLQDGDSVQVLSGGHVYNRDSDHDTSKKSSSSSHGSSSSTSPRSPRSSLPPLMTSTPQSPGGRGLTIVTTPVEDSLVYHAKLRPPAGFKESSDSSDEDDSRGKKRQTIRVEKQSPQLRYEKPRVVADIRPVAGDVNIPKVDGNVTVIQGPDASLPDIKNSEKDTPKSVEACLPIVDGKTEINMPTVDGSVDANVDSDLGGFTPKGDIIFETKVPTYEVSMPRMDSEVEVDMQTPGCGVDDVNINVPQTDDVNINVPKIDDVNITVPKIDDVNIDVPKTDGVLDVCLPKVDNGAGVSMPEMESGVDISLPSMDTSVNVEPPKIDGSANGSMDGGFDVCMPKLDGSFDVGMPKLEGGFDVSMPKLDGGFDVGMPKIDGGLDVDVPKLNGDVDVKIPTLDGGVNVNLPKFDGDVDILKPELDCGVDIDKPKLDAGLDIDIPRFCGSLDLDKSKGLGEAVVSMPKIDVCTPKIDADVDVNMPNMNADVDVNIPEQVGGVQVDMPNIDVDIPTFGGDVDVDIPKVDVNTPNLDGDMDVEMPQTKAGVDIKMPKLDVETPTGSMPSFDAGFDKASKGGGVDISLPAVVERSEVTLPKIDIEPITPNVSGSLAASLPSGNAYVPKIEQDIDILPDKNIPLHPAPTCTIDQQQPEYVGIVVVPQNSNVRDREDLDKPVYIPADSRYKQAKPLGEHPSSTSESESSSSSSSTSRSSGGGKSKAKIEKPKRKDKDKSGKKDEKIESPTVSKASPENTDTISPSVPYVKPGDISITSPDVSFKSRVEIEPERRRASETTPTFRELKYSTPSFKVIPEGSVTSSDNRVQSKPDYRDQHVPIPILDLDAATPAVDVKPKRVRPVSASSDSDTSSSSDHRRKSGGYKFTEYDSPRTTSFLSPSRPLSCHTPLNVSQTLATTSNHSLNGLDKLEASLAHSTPTQSMEAMPSIVRHRGHFVVVAIDFGTTFSGYALSFIRDPESVHMMRNWEGGDPGVINQKTPTTILLSPEGEFDSFGFTARDRYHNLTPEDAKKWLYFERFKMVLHHDPDLSRDTMLEASNGQPFPALKVFALAIRFFKEHALQQLTDQSGITIVNDDVRWVITVPAIWKAPAKQFMRTAAYEADLVSPDCPDQLLIALEPEAASIYCRKLRMYQLVPDHPEWRPLQAPNRPITTPLNDQIVCSDMTQDVTCAPLDLSPETPLENTIKGTRYIVVDCGGGTVDITVHELGEDTKLKELYKASGGPYGATGVDDEFVNMLSDIFGHEFIAQYRTKYPVGWLHLMINFESRKRSASPFKDNSLNVSLPFTFIDYYKKHKGGHIENAVKKYGNKEVTWSTEGMLRLTPHAMRCLFVPTMERIINAIGHVLNHPNARNLKYLFLVGGFAESPLLQHEIRKEFSPILKVLIPTGVSLAILKGAVLFGLDPTIVNIRRSRLTYGVGVLNRFDASRHPTSKLVHRDGIDWCTDVFDVFAEMDQPVSLGDSVIRSYTPAKVDQLVSVIHIYSSDNTDSVFITDPGVRKCGTLRLDLSDVPPSTLPSRREIQARMMFGDTEVKVTALDVATGRCVRAAIDFLNK